ncbi:phage tail protein [Pseudoalteromonas luteoviolacea]|uniref:phage tail-collar fiber domain-containing protein n=1 Tax=Pseudoalteromonas luteoviolacea TaxID=43657 RepID=UPI00114FC650|nr:phage tail protein [Pseudoalteromonas luteoviolacea]TQF69545.1 phage tail protein [Pseudoalteromonas luteoviolacea]
MSYAPVITQSGLNAAANAAESGISISINKIAVGDSGYVPSRAQTALVNQRDQTAVSGCSPAGPAQLHMTAQFRSEQQYAVREVGFYLEDGTLFAVWSHPVNVLFYLTPLSTTIQGFDLVLSAVPVDNIAVNVAGDINLFYGCEFVQLTIAQTRTATSALQGLRREMSMHEKFRNLGV